MSAMADQRAEPPGDQLQPTPDAVAAYVAFWQALSLETLPRLAEVAAPQMMFRDPFREAHGRQAVADLFAGHYRKLRDVVITVHDTAIGDAAAYLRWTFAFRIGPGRRQWALEGMSEVKFDADGLVVAHIDHFDAAGQVYERLPIVGPLIALIRRRV